jgi:hypothetical protein
MEGSNSPENLTETSPKVDSSAVSVLPRHNFLVLPNFGGQAAEDSRYHAFRKPLDAERPALSQSVDAAIKKRAENFGIPLTERQQEVATQTMDSMEAWSTERLGIDLTKRRPYIETMKKLTKDDPNYPPAGRGEFGAITSDHIIITPELDSTDTYPDVNPAMLELKGMAHELVHAYANVVLAVPDLDETERHIIDSFEPGKTISSGFFVKRISEAEGKRNDSLFAINEAVTEMINIENLNRLKTTQNIDLLTNLNHSYPLEVTLFDMIFNNMANKRGITPEAMRQEVYQMYFRGKPPITRLISSSFGHEAAKLIAEMDEKSSSIPLDAVMVLHAAKPHSVDEAKKILAQDQKFASLAKLMEMTGVNPIEFTNRIVAIPSHRKAEITGTSGKIEYSPT